MNVLAEFIQEFSKKLEDIDSYTEVWEILTIRERAGNDDCCIYEV